MAEEVEIVVPVSLAGLACVTVPAGFGDDGLCDQACGPTGRLEGQSLQEVVAADQLGCVLDAEPVSEPLSANVR